MSRSGNGVCSGSLRMPETLRKPLQIAPKTVWMVLGSTLAVVAGVFLFWELRTVISWILLAMLLALALDPIVRRLEARGLRRGWAVLIVFVVLIALIAVAIATVVPMLVDQGRELYEQMPALLRRVER